MKQAIERKKRVQLVESWTLPLIGFLRCQQMNELREFIQPLAHVHFRSHGVANGLHRGAATGKLDRNLDALSQHMRLRRNNEAMTKRVSELLRKLFDGLHRSCRSAIRAIFCDDVV